MVTVRFTAKDHLSGARIASMGSMKNGTTENALIRLFTVKDMAFTNRIGSVLTENANDDLTQRKNALKLRWIALEVMTWTKTRLKTD